MSSKGVANHRMNFQQPTSLEVLTLLYKELVNEAEVKMSSGNHKIKYSECEHSFTDSTGKPLSSKFIEMYIADSNPLVDGDKIDRNLYILI